MSYKRSPVAILLSFMLLAAACGSDDVTPIETSADAQSQPSDDGGVDESDAPGDPIPVEPDGGIGDGAEPLPGAEEPPADEGTWHGAEVAVTNCPGMEWKRVRASDFSFSVPADYFENDVQPIDSEIGMWTGGNKIEVSYDYGWYSGSLRDMAGAENELVDYSGIAGERTILRDGEGKTVGIYFGEVTEADGTWNALSMQVRYTDANDEIIGRCIVGSIQWNA